MSGLSVISWVVARRADQLIQSFDFQLRNIVRKAKWDY